MTQHARASGASRSVQPFEVLILGVALGLTYGFCEAAANGVFSLVPGALSWRSANSWPILWVAPLTYAAVFGLFGAVAAGLTGLLPRLPWDSALVFFVAWLGTYLLATLQGQLVSDVAAAILGVGIGVVALRIYRARRGVILPVARRSVLRLVMLVGLVCGLVTLGMRWAEGRRVHGLGPIPVGKPNVLLLVLDTQRGDHLSSQGYTRPTTPNLDTLAARGLIHLEAFSPSAWTLPSHATMFTGRPQSEHLAGIMRRPYLDARFPTVAEQLAAAGYVTGGFVANTFWCGRHSGLARGFHRYRDLYGNVGDALARTVLGRQLAYRVGPRFGAIDIPGRKSAAEVNREFLEWLEQSGPRPYFAFLNYLDVHAPYLPPPPFDGMFSGGPQKRTAASRIDIGALDAREQLRSPEAIRRSVGSYDESLRYLDSQIGMLLAELERRGKLENTLVLVTSDHGESFGEHDMLSHGHSLYRDQTHVPLILWWRGRITPGVETRPVATDRIPATVAEAVGLPAGTFPGASLLSGSGNDGPVVSELARRWKEAGRWPSSRANWLSVIQGRWHYLVPDSGSAELYDMTADRAEERNLAGDSAQAGLRAGLDSIVQRLRGEARRVTRR